MHALHHQHACAPSPEAPSLEANPQPCTTSVQEQQQQPSLQLLLVWAAAPIFVATSFRFDVSLVQLLSCLLRPHLHRSILEILPKVRVCLGLQPFVRLLQALVLHVEGAFRKVHQDPLVLFYVFDRDSLFFFVLLDCLVVAACKNLLQQVYHALRDRPVLVACGTEASSRLLAAHRCACKLRP